jgi:hypothetical protein
MRISRTFFALTIAVFAFSISAFSQEMKPLIAQDASLSQTQAWLAKTIDKNSTYHSGDSRDSISNVKFDGCRLSYTIEHQTGYNSSSMNLPGSASTSAPAYYSTLTTLALDLKNMNMGGITLTPLVSNTNMQMLTLYSLEGQKSVSFNLQPNNSRFSRTGFQATATLAVKADVAEKIKIGLVQAISFCQREK